MKQDEYDEFLSNPNGFAVKKLWPRISTVLAPIGGMAQMPALPLAFLSNAYTLPSLLGEMISAPPIKEILRKALELAEAHERNKQITIAYIMEMMNLGFPIPFAAITFPAFDWISDCFRGMKGAMLDMYQVPDKLLAAIDMFTPLTIGGCIMTAQQTGNKGVSHSHAPGSGRVHVRQAVRPVLLAVLQGPPARTHRCRAYAHPPF